MRRIREDWMDMWIRVYTTVNSQERSQKEARGESKQTSMHRLGTCTYLPRYVWMGQCKLHLSDYILALL